MKNPNRLWSVSPSSITAYRTCARQWYYGYVKGIRQPASRNQALGTSIHAALEAYLRTGEVLIEHENRDMPGVSFAVMEYVQAAAPLLPRPVTDKEYWAQYPPESNSGMMLEQLGEMGTWGDPDGTFGPSVKQYLDLVIALPDQVIVHDHKTLSNARFAKTPEELAVNVQLVMNARWVFSVSDYPKATLRHMYLLTKNKRPKAWTVETEVSRGHVEMEWQKILVSIREMAAYVALSDGRETADHLPPNTDACDMYAGCAFKPRCFGEGPLFSIRTNTRGKDDSMGALEKLLAKKRLETAPPAAAALPQTITSPPNEAPAEESSVAPTASAAPTTVGELPGYDPNGVVPPDAPLPTSTPEEVAAANGEAPAGEAPAEPTKRKRRTKLEMEAARAAEALAAKGGALSDAAPTTFQTTNIQVSAVAQPPTIGLTQHGTSIGIIAAPTAFQALPVVPTETAAPPAPESELDRIARTLATPDPAFACPVQVIFIDCFPGKGWPGEHPRDLLEYLHAFNGLAAASAGVTDYRMIEFKSGGYLATSIAALMKGLPSAVFVDSRIPGAAIFLERVVPYAKFVFRGMR